MKVILKFIIAFVAISTIDLNLTAYGQDKDPDGLTARQETIVPIAAFAAIGDQGKLTIALTQGLEAGLTVNEIKEILVQLYAYAGFPRSLNAIGTFQKVIEARKKAGKSDITGRQAGTINYSGSKYQFGKDNQAKLTGRSANSVQNFVPVIDTFLKEHLFADIFGRDNFDYQSREIATISILASIGHAEDQLRSHLGVGKTNGLTEIQLRCIATNVGHAVGTAAGNTTIRLIDALYNTNSTTVSANQTMVAKPVFPRGNKVNNDNFTGDVWLSMLTKVDAATFTSVGNVTFAPKARTRWHLHPSGQILLVTDGVGYYQEKGQPIRLIRKGDAIQCAANVAHWHGALPDSFMSHIALGPVNGKEPVIWMAKVTEEEYYGHP